ncbi:MAG TPA: futalosine hydrolase [Desulfobacteraceae bacterium]|nr:futalosine hydrolase [Desulfobacteraceae bacterium]
MKRTRVMVTAAVPEELGLIRDCLADGKTEIIGQSKVNRGSYSGYDLFLCVGGVGSVSMATTLTVFILTISPDYVMLIGSAGGFSQAGTKVLDVAIATEEIAAQLGVEGWPKGAIEPLNLAANQIELDQKLAGRAVAALKTSSMRVDVRSGPFVTVSTVTASRDTAENYYFTHRAIAENMEGFGAAYSCKFFGVPFLELRVVSNEVGDRNRARWQLDKACQRVQEVALSLLRSEVFR